jgi:hypothetical protein
MRCYGSQIPCLHLVYEMWDNMIEKVKAVIYRHEGKTENGESLFFNVVKTILYDRWAKSNTPLHCLAYSLNPKYCFRSYFFTTFRIRLISSILIVIN